MLGVLIAAFGMAAVETVRPARGKDDDDLALFVGSAHPVLQSGVAKPRSQNRSQIV